MRLIAKWGSMLAKRKTEHAIAVLHARRIMVMAVCVHDKYERIYVDHKYGMIVLTPNSARRYANRIELQEFERAALAR